MKLRVSAMASFDFVVVGAGVFGLTLSRALLLRDPKARILVIEKEPEVGRHTSGRNSGVLHQGIYYSPTSLKAKFCLEGAKAIRNFCEDKRLPIKKIGKIILPLRVEDDPQIDFLLDRARKNGSKIELIDQKAISSIEPEAKSLTGRGLYSPESSVIDPMQTLRALLSEVLYLGGQVRFGSEVMDVQLAKKKLFIGPDEISFGQLINTAGLHADKLAHACGLGKKYRLLPFRGIYSKLGPRTALKIRGLIYPVPDLRVPFLGVHFTPALSGETYIGPTALPALGRENYTGLKGVEWGDLFSISSLLLEQVIRDRHGFRRFAYQELSHLSRHIVARQAQALVPALKAEDIVASTKVGIRAQLLNLETRELVMDFLVESGRSSVHVLNAVSPGWTSALSFAEYLIDQYLLSPPATSERVAGAV